MVDRHDAVWLTVNIRVCPVRAYCRAAKGMRVEIIESSACILAATSPKLIAREAAAVSFLRHRRQTAILTLMPRMSLASRIGAQTDVT